MAGDLMRFPDVFAGRVRPVLSIEVYPPRTEKGMVDLRAILPRLIALGPRYMTVTYGAMGTTQERTLEIAALLKGELGLETASHLTCVGASATDIDCVLDRLASSGIENVVALRGDPPKGQDRFVAAEGGFAHADELVAHIRRRGDFGIAVAGYPEKHIEAPDMESDLACLKRKVEAGADLIITQLFFDNRDYFTFVERVRDLGIRVPVMPGILPVQSLAQVQKLTGLCGARVPESLRERLEGAGEDEDAVHEAGVAWAVEQCGELLERGAPGIHFYVLNRARPMERIVAELRPALEGRR